MVLAHNAQLLYASNIFTVIISIVIIFENWLKVSLLSETFNSCCLATLPPSHVSHFTDHSTYIPL